MAKTKIQWSEEVWNPIAGCSRVSKGCERCYAEVMANRLQSIGIEGYEGVIKNNKWTGKINFIPSKLGYPLHLKKPKMIFVNSMSDLFHEEIPFTYIDNALNVMVTNPRHIYQILTKRPKRLLEFCNWQSKKIKDAGFNSWEGKYFEFPDFIWIGVSVENQKAADERIPLLLQTPAAVRWLSVEPMLEPIDLSKYIDKLDWIVVGCES